MLDWLFIMLLVIAVLLIIMSIEYEGNPFWNLITCILSTVLWFILALGVLRLDTPYQIFNSTSGNLETGMHSYTVPGDIYIAYIFIALGVLTMIYFIAMAFDKYNELKDNYR